MLKTLISPRVRVLQTFWPVTSKGLPLPWLSKLVVEARDGLTLAEDFGAGKLLKNDVSGYILSQSAPKSYQSCFNYLHAKINF